MTILVGYFVGSLSSTSINRVLSRALIRVASDDMQFTRSPSATCRYTALTTSLLKEFEHSDVIDLGDISTERGTEMLLPVWLRLMGALGTPMFNFKIVR